jgi:TonB family protein
VEPPAAAAPRTGTTPQPEPELAAPRILSAPLTYPAGGQGQAEVLLELIVGRDGTVRSASVESGPEPFASAALEAVRDFRFEPARRGGQPVPARIRFEVKYVPPPEPLVTPEPQAQAAQVTASARPRVTRVQVLGEVEPGAHSLSSAEARILPGAFGDPFRAVASLPGVVPMVTGLPVFYVRGSPPGNLGFLVDGVRVPLLFHAFLGPAVIHPRLLERTELHAGAYPASLGRFAGGVVTADLAEPRGELNGQWSVRLLDAGLFLDVPFAGGKGNLMAAGRYSYTALLVSLLSAAELDYWDYQVLASYDLTSRDRLSVFTFGAYDFAGGGEPAPGEASTVGDGDSAVLFHRLDVRYDHRYGEGSRLRAAGTLGLDVTQGAQGRVRDQQVAGRLELESRLSSTVTLRAGASAGADHYRLELDPNTENYTTVLELFPTRWDSVLGAYGDLVLDLGAGVTLTPGLRVDRYGSLGHSALGVSPRLSVSYRLSPALTIEHLLGIADQPPNFVPSVPGVAVAGLPGGLQRSVQSSAGVRAELPWQLRARVNLFQNAFFQLTDPFGQRQDLDLDIDEARVRSLGQAYGLELLLQRPLLRGFGGMLSYTLSRSTRSHDRIHTVSGYDRTHVLNASGSVELGAHWLASAQSVLYSGVPGSRALGEWRMFDRSRARPFFRLDLRLEKRFRISDERWWAVVAELMNATLSREVLRRPCDRRCENDYVGPIFLPSVGVTGQF